MIDDVHVGNRHDFNAQRPAAISSPKAIDRKANTNPVFVVAVRHGFVGFKERTFYFVIIPVITEFIGVIPDLSI